MMLGNFLEVSNAYICKQFLMFWFKTDFRSYSVCYHSIQDCYQKCIHVHKLKEGNVEASLIA